MCSYDVFLSFSGKDIGNGFAGHLYEALVDAGFDTFRDDGDDIKREKDMNAELKREIEQSRVAIVVFSKTYASSRRCLDELVDILHRHENCELHVIPVFYDVNPSQVRRQKKSFAEAFSRHEEMSLKEATEERKQESMERIKKWRKALKVVSDVAGLILQNDANGHEAAFIKKIVEEIADKLSYRALTCVPCSTTINSRVKDISFWLQNDSTNVSIIALCGKRCMGKTTIANFVYSQCHKEFDASTFLENIKACSKEPNSLVSLQKKILSDLQMEENISCLDAGACRIEQTICRKRVLIVLDNVDQVDQVNAVCGMQKLFIPGSKILVTTRNERLLEPHQAYKLHLMASIGTQEPIISSAYDVFLSFSGKDTRKGFVDHLNAGLVRAGFRTFRDDSDIKRGENIRSELKRGIEQSKISIIVFSKTYTSSTWCLDELIQILQCQKTSGLHVLPVFYDVDQSQLMLLQDTAAKAFARHEKRFKKDSDEGKQELLFMEGLKRPKKSYKEIIDLEGLKTMSSIMDIGEDNEKIMEKMESSSYFLPGNKVPYEFTMQTAGSRISFIIPSVDKFCATGLIVCIECTSTSIYEVPHFFPTEMLYIRIENRTRQKEWMHYPVLTSLINEELIWLSHWRSGTPFGDGDMLEISVAASPFQVKKVAMELVYSQTNCGATTEKLFLYQDLISGRCQ